MKKLFTFTILAFSAYFTMAQTVLTRQSHALKAGENNPMKICSYANAGIAGEDMVWNFSSLKFEKDFTGILKEVESNTTFEDSKLVLNEFGSKFFFNLTENTLEQVGYESPSGNLKMKYDVPYVKMKYPLGYNDYFSGVFIGEYEVSGKKYGDIDGNYFIEADAYGSLILPQNTQIDNVLRVKTEKNYTVVSTNSERDVNITTYRWYNAHHRYPILVLTEMVNTSNGKESKIYQAAYNTDVVKSTNSVKQQTANLRIFPTYVKSSLKLEISSDLQKKATLAIYNIDGSMVKNIDASVMSGSNLVSLDNEIQNLAPATYILKVNVEGKSDAFEFIKMH